MDYFISAFNFALEVFKSADYIQTGIFVALLCSIIVIIIEKRNREAVIFCKIVLIYIASVFIFTFLYYIFRSHANGLEGFSSRAYDLFKWNDIIGVQRTWSGIFEIFKMIPGFIKNYASSSVVCILAIVSCVVLKQYHSKGKIGIGMLLVVMLVIMSPAISSMNISCDSFELAGDNLKIGSDVRVLQKTVGINSVLVPKNIYNKILRSSEKGNVCALYDENSVTVSAQQCVNSKISYVLVEKDKHSDTKQTRDMLAATYKLVYVSDIGKYSLYKNTN